MTVRGTTGFFTLGVRPEQYDLPHPRLGLPVILLLRRVLLRAFEKLRERGFLWPLNGKIVLQSNSSMCWRTTSAKPAKLADSTPSFMTASCGMPRSRTTTCKSLRKRRICRSSSVMPAQNRAQ